MSEKYMTPQGRKTSITDNNSYPAFCYAASKEPELLKDFRRNPIYTEVLEHVLEQEGQIYLDVIARSQAKFTAADWDNFLKNDTLGNPRTFSYNIDGRMLSASPTTLRYAKVLSDILALYDTEKIRSIAEIGIGYGGQCRLLTSHLKTLEHYHLIDLPEVLELAKKYLSQLSASPLEFVDGTKLDTDIAADLVISNYAFSELIPEVQEIYLNHVILHAKAGYITYNPLAYNQFGSYSAEQLLNKIPGSYIIPEEPLTFPGNCIIVWSSSGNRKNATTPPPSHKIRFI